MKRVYKAVKDNEGREITIYGSNKWIRLEWDHKSAEDESIQYFRYAGRRYNLSDFMNIHNTIYNPNPYKWMLEFDGYNNDSFFSGVLIKLDEEGEAVKAYTYIS